MMVKFEVTRDSVCMGDDVDAPYYAEFYLKTELSQEQLIVEILDNYKLASVASPLVYWPCTINNVLVATIMASENSDDEIILEKNIFIKLTAINKVYFKYVY